MGFFDFLKKKEDVVELTEKQLFSFFESAVSQKFAKLNAKVHEIRIETNYNIKRIKEYLDFLESEDLMNPNIHPKEKQMMEGNRENFLKRVRLFINTIQAPESYMEINDYCKNFFDDLEALTKETQRNTFVLKEFFAESVKKISRKISQIEKLFIELRGMLEKENIEKVSEIKEFFKGLEESKQQLTIAKEEKHYIEAELNLLEQEKEKILKKIHSLEASNDYKFFKGFLKEKEELAQKEADEKKEIYEIFAILDKSLKKYSKVSIGEKIIADYLKNPVNALLNDKNLDILKVLAKVKKEVEKDTLDLKDKKKEKTLESIEKLTKSFILEKKKLIALIISEKEANSEKIRKNTTNLQLKEQESYLESTHQKIREQKSKFEAAENKIESTNPNLFLQKIAKSLSELSGKDVKWKR